MAISLEKFGLAIELAPDTRFETGHDLSKMDLDEFYLTHIEENINGEWFQLANVKKIEKS